MSLLIALSFTGGCAFLTRLRGGEVEQGITSESHKQHIGGIVFSGAQIEFKKEDPASFKDSFTLGDPLYGRLYLARSLGSEAKAQGGVFSGYGIRLRASADGKNIADIFTRMEPQWSTLTFALARGADTDKWEQTKWFWKQVATTLTKGKHELLIEAIGDTSESGKKDVIVLAKGTITLDVKADSAKTIAQAIALEERLFPRYISREESGAAAHDFEVIVESDCRENLVIRFGPSDYDTVPAASGGSVSFGLRHTAAPNTIACVKKEQYASECLGPEFKLVPGMKAVKIQKDCLTFVRTD